MKEFIKAGMILSVTVILLSSCSTSKLTTYEQNRRNKVDYELDKLWTEYEYKRDSLIIEYYKIIDKPKKKCPKYL